MPPAERRVRVGNAPTFVGEARGPGSYTLDLAALAGCTRPVLMSHGDQSSPRFPPVVAKLAAVLPRAELRVFFGGRARPGADACRRVRGGGHGPSGSGRRRRAELRCAVRWPVRRRRR